MEDCKPMQKKSLMNSLENFDYKAESLNELAELSNRLVKKFTHPRPQPEGVMDGCMNKECGDAQPPDLIDLFNMTADRMQTEVNVIGSNLERLLDMVE